jgi:two-component system response regulator
MIEQGKHGHGTLVIAEDDQNDFILLERALGRAGGDFTIYRGQDGTEAMELLRREKLEPNSAPVCLIVDLNMPVMNGFELLACLRADHTFKSIPIVVLTASSDPADVSRAYALGASFYFVKPTRFEALVELLRTFQGWWTCSARASLPLTAAS